MEPISGQQPFYIAMRHGPEQQFEIEINRKQYLPRVSHGKQKYSSQLLMKTRHLIGCCGGDDEVSHVNYKFEGDNTLGMRMDVFFH